MKRGVRHILTHTVLATIVWATVFLIVFPNLGTEKFVRNNRDFINGKDVRYYERIELSTGFHRSPKEPFSLLYRFLWMHWSGRDHGLAQMGFCGIDAGAINYFLVEKDSSGQWVISVESQHYQVPGSEEYPIQHVATIYYVERVELKDRGELGKVLDPTEELDGDFGLRFFDKNHQPVDLGLQW